MSVREGVWGTRETGGNQMTYGNGWGDNEPGRLARAQARRRRELAERLENQNVSWLGDPDVVESYYEDSPAFTIARFIVTVSLFLGIVAGIVVIVLALGSWLAP